MPDDESRGWLNKLAGDSRSRNIIVGVGVLGIALIFLSGLFHSPETPKAKTDTEPPAAQEYAKEMEQKLTTLVGGIQGAGETQVLVTLERSAEQVYATEEKTSTQTQSDSSGGSAEKSYILVKDADGAQKALEITEVQPIIKGVVVVCQGGDNPAVQQNVINAVTTALDLSSARVCVIRAK